MVAGNFAHLGRAARGTYFVEELNIRLVVVGPLARKVVLVVDRLDRADRLTGTAVHALVGVDVKHAVALVDAVNGALFDASFVFNIDAGKGDYVSHDSILSVTDTASAPNTWVNSWEQDHHEADDERAPTPVAI